MAATDEVLVLYEMLYDARYPTVCLDEKSVALHAEVREGLPPKPGQVERRDYEYERHGTATLFVMVEPLAGWRHVAVTEHRTKQDDAECLRELVEERYPDADASIYRLAVHRTPRPHQAQAPLFGCYPAVEAPACSASWARAPGGSRRQGVGPFLPV